MGLRHGRADQRERLDRGEPDLHHDLRRLDLVPAPKRRAQDLGPLHPAGLPSLRELLRQSVNGWQATVHDLALGRDLCALGYSTPAVSQGRVFIGGFDGRLRAFRASTGRVLWSRYLGGRFLGPAFVAGNLVFASNLERQTYALRVSDGKVLWHLRIGKYSPGIVTERHYFFTLNGIVMAWHGRRSPQILELQRKRRLLAQKRQSAQPRVTTAPKRRTP
jgi:hypothetical protein